MFNPMQTTRTWGFRFSPMDAVVIGIFMSLMIILWIFQSVLWWILVLVAVHFFLFCNVFRIARRPELIWAALFVSNVGIWAWFDHLSWQPVVLCQLPFTILLVLWEMLSPMYHGVFASRLNRRLNEYLGKSALIR
jgi:hypothetical protein